MVDVVYGRKVIPSKDKLSEGNQQVYGGEGISYLWYKKYSRVTKTLARQLSLNR